MCKYSLEVLEFRNLMGSNIFRENHKAFLHIVFCKSFY